MKEETKRAGFLVETWKHSEFERAPEPLPFSVPRLPGFRVEEELGRGAMGRVYRAFDLKRGRAVALKVSAAVSAEEVDRFRLEGELQRQLHHPAVPRVLGAGRLPDGRAYLIQSLVRGAQTLLPGGLEASWVTKVEWIAAAAEALAVAHGRCVSHGDIKPDNLLVDERGQVALIDWGVSRLSACAAPAPAQLSPPLMEIIRRSEDWVEGTLAYMPPEQLTGRPVPESDIYSLGLVLCELSGGVHPLERLMHDADGMVQEILRGPDLAPPADQPEALRELLARALSKRASLRPPAVEFARVLRRLARNERRRLALERLQARASD